MNVIDLARVDAALIGLAGGKAAGLGELIGAGERVPAGFCVTTEVHAAARDTGAMPPAARAEIVDAYRRLGGGAVAVRSSATAEDLPEASFAGQQETYLNVRGAEEVVDAVRRCWDSLWTERATAYREANGIDHGSVRMAVVVQRMIEPRVAGVLFTADPVTGGRDTMTVDAAPGPGVAVVEGTVVPDHYVLRAREPAASGGGCLDAARLEELRAAGLRVQRHFGTPQDIEWAIDADGVLWLLQSRPVTGLFPLPPDTGRPHPRVYLNFSPAQGMHRPFTPMGMAVMKMATARWWNAFGVGDRAHPIDGPAGIVDVGGRMFGDATRYARSRTARRFLLTVMRIEGPRVAAALELVLRDPRFRPRPGLPVGPRSLAAFSTRLLPSLIAATARTLARPDAVRARAFETAERMRRAIRPPAEPAAASDRLRFVEGAHASLLTRTMVNELVWPVYAGVLAADIPVLLLKGVASEGEVRTVLGGMPHNVTTEMDLELWRLAANAREHRDLLVNTPPAELAAGYRRGELPDIGLEGFLAAYGHRAAAEVDVGRPRWIEDPAPVFTAIANYLRVTDPEQAPDRRFVSAARAAETKLEELVRRARSRRPVRARLAGFLLRRARAVCGLRELPKFVWTRLLHEVRRQLLLVGAELAGRGLLDRPEDVMFLDVREAWAAVAGADMRDRVAGRRAEYEREVRRRHVPNVLLSDGTDMETLVPALSREGALVGMPGATGVVTGPARVISDPSGARLEPGEILVAPSTDPGWTPLFMTAGGLVTETGGPNSHGPTVAREYGIPAVIGVARATHEIRTGRRVTLDGAAGVVRLEPPAAAGPPAPR
ncbi:PEP/pyruvate-binding domain-containing protein [Thermomonospora catenispora]|uniref:PEP/pyruvate-binding domain-containing protein n=1 Tax=Thermomonospora catenispora TaxID=2493090 RepID=UPI00112079C8|nr:PEP/pyruvate-binding domain-containing protein [Thermomonospora catenispora]TNY35375.1 pyruvate, water dikinase [Thermomonospora catenispora]